MPYGQSQSASLICIENRALEPIVSKPTNFMEVSHLVDKDTRSSEKDVTLICCLCGEDCTAEESLELQSIYD